MSDRFHPLDTPRLAAWIKDELVGAGSIFGIPRELFFTPSPDHRFRTSLRGQPLETPIGVAAGPHTQLAQNIITAWLCGARVIELKTVQTLDEIEVAKPCIDMRDEGYNIEWSQELRVHESFAEYLRAWVLIHVLHRHLGFPGERPGIVFDLSIGYDLEGIQEPNMKWYLEHMIDAGEELATCMDEVSAAFPEIRDLEISSRLADSVTLSTLHGCPPDEIGAIAEYLLDVWEFHTAIKLNPTLLGCQRVSEIMAEDLGWRNVEPYGPAFDADIDYDQALILLRRLKAFGDARGLGFSIKLSNTLPVVNRCGTFDDTETTAYLSGRPLHALAVELARRLTHDLEAEIPLSFAGGADAFNTPALLAACLFPVTTCSDLLRPGGYLRLGQYIEQIDAALDRTASGDLAELILRTAGDGRDATVAGLANLDRYADGLTTDPALARTTFRRDRTKTSRGLGFFDCIQAPCTDACGIDQWVPEYMRRVAAGDIDGAAAVIDRDNPLPSVLGRACHHPCENVCLRTHLDQPVAIREIKRFVTDSAGPRTTPDLPRDSSDLRVAIVGGGPCGLAAAVDLVRAGADATIYEARHEGGGMVSATIPGYRASAVAVRRDLDAVAALGVTMVFGVEIGSDLGIDRLFQQGFHAVVVSVGAQRGLAMGLADEDATGVLDGLDFLRSVGRGSPPDLGRRVGVVGGGDVAMDCARSAARLVEGDVEILYRRTAEEMPAHPDEIHDLRVEGIEIRELVTPRDLVLEDGRLRAVICTEMALGEPDASGRPRPVELPGDGLSLELDSLIVAIGQRVDLTVFSGCDIRRTAKGFVEIDPTTHETSMANIFAGGDVVVPGPSNIVDACGDGRRIAAAILRRFNGGGAEDSAPFSGPADLADLLKRRSRRSSRVLVPETPASDRTRFDEVSATLDPTAARREAARCLDCDHLCSTCDGVCPNRAILTYRLAPELIASPTIAIGQGPQVAVIADFCNECGNCVTFCPTAGRPWLDKPRIYLNRREFEEQQDNAFMLLRTRDRTIIQGRFGGRLHQLGDGDEVLYEGPGIRARLDLSSPEVIELHQSADGAQRRDFDLEPCSVLLTLLRGFTHSIPYLPLPAAEPDWLIQLQ